MRHAALGCHVVFDGGAHRTLGSSRTGAGWRREDNIWVFDVRTEKTVSLTRRVRTRLFLDLFNLTNSSGAETITRSTGRNFLRPAAILAPRTARLGVRLLW